MPWWAKVMYLIITLALAAFMVAGGVMLSNNVKGVY